MEGAPAILTYYGYTYYGYTYYGCTYDGYNNYGYYLPWKARQLLRQGRLYDSQDFARHLQWFTLGLTFKEAYERTGRVLNISCTPLRSRGHLAPPLMLNHIDTPHVGTASSNTHPKPKPKPQPSLQPSPSPQPSPPLPP